MPDATAQSEDFGPYESKGVPQRLKPSGAQPIYGTAEAVPFVKSFSSPAKVPQGHLGYGPTKEAAEKCTFEGTFRLVFGCTNKEGCEEPIRSRVLCTVT